MVKPSWSGVRSVLKLSGEHISEGSMAFGPDVVWGVCQQIMEARRQMDAEVAIIVGGGNLIRGKAATKRLRNLATPLGLTVSDSDADELGLLATLMNCKYLRMVLKILKVPNSLVSAFDVPTIFKDCPCQRFDPEAQKKELSEGKVVIMAGGLAQPGITTDTAAVVRARQLGASVVHKATKVDGIYSADPNDRNLHVKPEYFRKITCTRFQELGLGGVLDAEAVVAAKEGNIPIHVFQGFEGGSIRMSLEGYLIGTEVEPR